MNLPQNSPRNWRIFSRGFCITFLILCTVLENTTSAGDPRRVPQNFFGINGQAVPWGEWGASPNHSAHHFRAMTNMGIEIVRRDAAWVAVERYKPGGLLGNQHQYYWTGDPTWGWAGYDRWVSNLVQHGLRWLPVLDTTPDWAQSLVDANRAQKSSWYPPGNTNAFALYCQEFAKRYGRTNATDLTLGSFWKAHPSLPYRPVIHYEIWNEPNYFAFWQPKPDAAAYMNLFATAREKIKGVDPDAMVFLGALASVDINFIQQMWAANPAAFAAADVFSVHIYETEAARYFSELAKLRHLLNSFGLTNMPIAITETGANTAGGTRRYISEGERAELFSTVMAELARSDCGVIMVTPHTWRTTETDLNDAEHWFGIAHEDTTGTNVVLHATATNYANVIQLFYTTNAPRSTVRHSGHPLPDSDGDGVLDQYEWYPFDASITTSNALPVEASEFYYTPRLSQDFFGVYGESLLWMNEDPAVSYLPLINAHMAKAKASGVDNLRARAQWNWMQPNRDTNYSWYLDDFIVRLARNKLRFVPVFTGIPAWSSDVFRSPLFYTNDFAAFAGAFARRYGKGGELWSKYPYLADYHVNQYEIWQNQNNVGNWWPGANAANLPGLYADLYLAARQGIQAQDPNARVIVGSMYWADAIVYSSFITSMYSARPSLQNNVDAYGLILIDNNFSGLTNLISLLRIKINSLDSATPPMIITGTRWPTAGPTNSWPMPVTQSQAEENYTKLTKLLAEGDIYKIAGFYPYQWWSSELDTNNGDHWTGLVNHEAGPANGSPLTLNPSGTAYSYEALLYRGKISGTPPPTNSVVYGP